MIAVVGTGAWGTAIAAILAGRVAVCLWGRDPAKVAQLARTRRHPALGERALPAALQITAEAEPLAEAELVLWAVPVQHSRALAQRLRFAPRAPLVSLAKGLEEGSLARVSEILAATQPGRPLAALSGPSHAIEILAGLPACLVAAGEPALCQRLVALLHDERLRIYTSADLLGVELAGALKNVVAIASGICEGLGLGDNARAALIARGLAEMRRLGRALGAHDATFAGVAGVGDLLTTCYAPHGRNRALGLALARGENPMDFLSRPDRVAEGAWTSRAAVELGRRVGIEMPIAAQVSAVIWEGLPVATALQRLLSRSPKEDDA
ncbi:MAG: NAD(P)H-dependent glycerol-3-phosphate dehydrogenase [Planctomycetota bacterium]|nr:NAD(P)-dependent glycerol-3-phosphate dehydrogenase [Planctomycetota bacterium]MCX8039698.1 NAD(P)-dependent glycerol-3-phosphate dehydrogenase [Planctomycetota bacterium]MDW8372878.1 NAD(P)H-dependent glycerol-3-phosphate dehydrogenase [Planctomycetota bacterium]